MHQRLGACLIKVMITRNQTQRGYPSKTTAVNRTVLGFKGCSLPLNPSVDVVRSKVILSEQPLLAGLKHLNRLENILASKDIQGTLSEVLLCNQHGCVIEGSKSNLFVYDGQWLTPKLDRSGVAGVSRAWLMDQMRKQGSPVIETTIPYEALNNAQSLFMTNSVIGVCPVKRLDGIEKNTDHVEPVKQLIEKLWS